MRVGRAGRAIVPVVRLAVANSRINWFELRIALVLPRGVMGSGPSRPSTISPHSHPIQRAQTRGVEVVYDEREATWLRSFGGAPCTWPKQGPGGSVFMLACADAQGAGVGACRVRDGVVTAVGGRARVCTRKPSRACSVSILGVRRCEGCLSRRGRGRAVPSRPCLPSFPLPALVPTCLPSLSPVRLLIHVHLYVRIHLRPPALVCALLLLLSVISINS
jgi:hypothetical protein